MTPEQEEFKTAAVRPMDCISEGWNLVSQNLGIHILIGLIAILLVGILGIIGIGWFLYGPIMVGIYYVFLRQIRGESIEFGMMFSGFKFFFPAMLVGLVVLGPSIAARIYDHGFQIAELLAIYSPNQMTGGLVAAIWAFSFVFKSIIIILTFLVNILFLFSFPLFMERGLGLVETMKLSAKAGWSNAGNLFLLTLLNGLIFIAGFLACCVGLLFALPLIFAANSVAYRQVFPDASAPQNMAPPSPEQYNFQQ